MKIGELARRTGCKIVTIRYYEKQGLLEAPERSDSNYRLYSGADVERLRFIRHCRALGMSLEEVRQLLALQAQPEGDCSAVDQLLDAHLKTLDEHISSLLHLKEHLVALKGACSGGQNAHCGILQRITAPLEKPHTDYCAVCALRRAS